MAGTLATIGQVLLDILIFVTLVCLNGVFFILVPPVKRGFACDDLSLYHTRQTPVSVPFQYLLAVTMGVPFVALIILELLHNVIYPRRKTERASRYVVSVVKLTAMFLYGYAITCLFTEVLKTTCGKLRPHFMETCQPDFSKINCSHGIIVEFNCTSTTAAPWELVDIRKSFPSGHASLSVYAATYFVLYLEHRMVLSFSVFLKSLLQAGALVAAIYASVSRIFDNRHHPEDVLAGAILGAITGIWAVFILAKHMRQESSIVPEPGGQPTAAEIKEGASVIRSRNCKTDRESNVPEVQL